jgi:CBS domain-containing protein
MTIAAILQGKGTEVISTTSDTLVRDAVALIAERRIGALPVIDDGRVVGVFSERDVMACLAEAGAGALDKSVGDVMTSPAVTAEPGTPVIAGLSLMTRRRIRHLPVLEGDVVIGIVSIGDLVKYRIDRIESEASAMREYIQGA